MGVNARCSEQINSGTSGGSKRSRTRTTEEYKRSACEVVLCELQDFGGGIAQGELEVRNPVRLV
jgi:hypothetical protein